MPVFACVYVCRNCSRRIPSPVIYLGGSNSSPSAMRAPTLMSPTTDGHSTAVLCVASLMCYQNYYTLKNQASDAGGILVLGTGQACEPIAQLLLVALGSEVNIPDIWTLDFSSSVLVHHRNAGEHASSPTDASDERMLEKLIHQLQPRVLIGASGSKGVMDAHVMRAVCLYHAVPVVFLLDEHATTVPPLVKEFYCASAFRGFALSSHVIPAMTSPCQGASVRHTGVCNSIMVKPGLLHAAGARAAVPNSSFSTADLVTLAQICTGLVTAEEVQDGYLTPQLSALSRLTETVRSHYGTGAVNQDGGGAGTARRVSMRMRALNTSTSRAPTKMFPSEDATDSSACLVGEFNTSSGKRSRAGGEAVLTTEQMQRHMISVLHRQIGGRRCAYATARDLQEYVEDLFVADDTDIVNVYCDLLDADNDGIITEEELELIFNEGSNDKRMSKQVIRFFLGRKSETSVRHMMNALQSDVEVLNNIRQQLVNAVSTLIARTNQNQDSEHIALTTVQSCGTSREKWLFIGIWVLFLVLSICVGILEGENGLSPDICIAKGCGFAITVTTTLVYLTKLSPLCWFLPDSIGFVCSYTSLHAHLGVIMCAFGMVHTVAGLSHTAVWHMFSARTTTCGIVLFCIILAMTLSATKRLNSSRDYFPFLQTHKLSYIFLPVLLAHVPKRLYAYLPIFVLWACCELWKFRNTEKKYLCAKSKGLGESGCMLVLPRSVKSARMVRPAGSYFLINVPSISEFDWHPFSVTSHTVAPIDEFLISNVGRWTRQLTSTITRNVENTDPTATKVPVYIQGPFWSPAVKSLRESAPLLICSGVGITPFLSVLSQFVIESTLHQAAVSGTEDQEGMPGGGSTVPEHLLIV